MKIQYIDEIIKMILKEYPESNTKKMMDKLLKASEEEVERVYDAFCRYGCKNILENIH